jgi:hypothetical protein
MNAADFHYPAERAKATQRRQGLDDRVGRQQAGGLNLATQSSQSLLVEDRDQAARHRFVDDEAH